VKRSYNDMESAPRTAAPPNPEPSSADEGDEFLAEAERMTREWEQTPHLQGGGVGFLSDPEQRRQYVEGLARTLRESAGVSPRPRKPVTEDEPMLFRSADECFRGEELRSEEGRKKYGTMKL